MKLVSFSITSNDLLSGYVLYEWLRPVWSIELFDSTLSHLNIAISWLIHMRRKKSRNYDGFHCCSLVFFRVLFSLALTLCISLPQSLYRSLHCMVVLYLFRDIYDSDSFCPLYFRRYKTISLRTTCRTENMRAEKSGA